MRTTSHSESHPVPDSIAGMLEARTLNLTMDFCLRVGELLLSSGAGAADVTATMQSLAWHFGRPEPRHRRHLHVAVDELPGQTRRSRRSIQMRQVKQRDIDYEDLTLVDHLVRDVIAGGVDLTEARAAGSPGSSRRATALPRWAVTARLGCDVRRASPSCWAATRP